MALTQVDERGRTRLADVGEEPVVRREAAARGWVVMAPETLALIQTGSVPQGDVLTTARLAGIMAAKRTADLIPLCHPLPLDSAAVECRPDDASNAVEVTATVRATGRSGVETQALTAAAVAALTIHDMCRPVDRSLHIESVRLVEPGGEEMVEEERGY